MSAVETMHGVEVTPTRADIIITFAGRYVARVGDYLIHSISGDTFAETMTRAEGFDGQNHGVDFETTEFSMSYEFGMDSETVAWIGDEAYVLTEPDHHVILIETEIDADPLETVREGDTVTRFHGSSVASRESATTSTETVVRVTAHYITIDDTHLDDTPVRFHRATGRMVGESRSWGYRSWIETTR